MLNKIMIIGNLGKEPDMSYTQGGTAFTKFTVAVNRRMRDRETNEMREETQWFNVIAWEKRGEFAGQYLHKGSKVFVEGRMTSRKYTDPKDNQERTFWEIVAENIQPLDPKGAGAAAGGAGGTSAGGYGDEVGADDIPF